MGHWNNSPPTNNIPPAITKYAKANVGNHILYVKEAQKRKSLPWTLTMEVLQRKQAVPDVSSFGI